MADQEKAVPSWKRFELFVAGLQKKLASDAEVSTNEKIIGTSGIFRQIDVSIRKKVGQYSLLIVMDCKDWKVPVDIKGVEEFVGLVEDVKANKGAIVCNRGFTDAAKKRAQQKGIDLFNAVDAESKDWPVYIAIPAVFDFRRVKSFRVSFHHSGQGPFMMPNIDPRLIEVFSLAGEKIDTIGNLIKKAWNEGRLPRDPGAHEHLPLYGTELFTKVDDVIYGPIDISFSICVEKNLYFGQVPLIQLKGFRDEITGSLTTDSFTTDDLDIREVEKKWQKINSIDELAVTPVLVIIGTDHYPLLP